MVGEGVERAPARLGQGRHRRVIVGLIQKPARLGVVQEIGGEPVRAQTVDRLPGVAAEETRPATRGAAPRSRARAVIRATMTRGSAGRGPLRRLRAHGVHRHGGRLHDDGVSVAVDDQAGQAVALGVHDAVGVAAAGSWPRGAASAVSRRSATSSVNVRGAAAGSRVEHAQGDRPRARPRSRCRGACRAGPRRVTVTGPPSRASAAGPRTNRSGTPTGTRRGCGVAPRALTTAIARASFIGWARIIG